MNFLFGGSSTNSQTLFACNDFISASIALSHSTVDDFTSVTETGSGCSLQTGSTT